MLCCGSSAGSPCVSCRLGPRGGRAARWRRTQHDSNNSALHSLSQTLFAQRDRPLAQSECQGHMLGKDGDWAGRQREWISRDQMEAEGDIRIEMVFFPLGLTKVACSLRLLIKHAQCSCFFLMQIQFRVISLQDNLIWKDSSRGTQRPFSKCYFSHKEYLMQIDGYKHTYLGRIIMAWKLNE